MWRSGFENLPSEHKRRLMLNSDSAMVETGVEEAPNVSYCHDVCSITGVVYKKLKLNVDF